MNLNQFLFLFQHVKDRRADASEKREVRSEKLPVPDSTRSGFVENNGFEPLTPCVQSRCSSQLS